MMFVYLYIYSYNHHALLGYYLYHVSIFYNDVIFMIIPYFYHLLFDIPSFLAVVCVV